MTALLLALTAPVLSLNLGFPDDGTLPESQTAAAGLRPRRRGLRAGDQRAAGDRRRHLERRERRRAARGRRRRRPGRRVGAPSRRSTSTAGVATMVAIPTTAPQDDATLRDRRSGSAPRCSRPCSPDTTAPAHIGGSTANFGDVGRPGHRSAAGVHRRRCIALSFVLLMLVFRSVLVPLKAALLNLLSIGAAYGVLVMVFQWGWGKDLIGLESTVPIVSFIPMFMFAILFGLSMDYEVFLLSRVREEYLAHRRQRHRGDPRHRQHRPGDHVGGADHDLGVRRLRARERPDDEDVRPRPRDGDLRRRDDRADRAGAGDDEADGRRQLVAAGVARPDPARRSTSTASRTCPSPIVATVERPRVGGGWARERHHARGGRRRASGRRGRCRYGTCRSPRSPTARCGCGSWPQP